MAALPTKKISKRRGRIRRSGIKVKIPQLISCPTCKKQILPHTVCPYCGFYKKQAVIKKEATTKVTRVTKE